MSKKGIIIDVGFKADIKDFINDIEKDFKKVDFDSVVGLSDAFDKQAKDVKKKLLDLKTEIDEVINGKIPNDPTKQLKNLNKAVGVLASSFRELIKNTPNMDEGLLGQLNEITSEVNQVSDVCDNAANVVKNLKNTTNGGIQFVDSKQRKQLEELFKLLEKGNQALEKFYTNRNKHGNQPYIDEEDALRDIIAQNEIYEESLKQINAIEKDTTLSSQERIEKLDKLYSTFARTISDLARTINSYSSLGGDLGEEIDSSLTKSGLKSLEKLQSQLEGYYNQTLEYIAQRKAEIQKSYYDLGGDDLQEMFKKSTAKGDSIKVPISISTRSSTILNQAIEIIKTVNDKLVNNPLEIEVKLISSWKSKSNQKILNEINDNIQNIDDKEIRKRILSLIDNMSKQIDNALLFNVDINTEKATNAVKKFVQDAKDELNELGKNLLPLEPEVVLTKEHKEAFQKQLDEAKGDFKIQVGIMDGDDTVDNNATKKELSYLKLLRERVEEVSNAVNEKSLAFIDEEGIVKDVVTNEREYLNQLYADLLLIESQIKDIIESFKLIPEKLKINLDDEMMQSLNNLANHEALSKISDLKKILSSSINYESGTLIEIPEDQKKQLLKDVQKLSDEINSIFKTKSLDKWTSKFLSSLSDISRKIQTLFGDNALNDMIDQWIYSDELMKKTIDDKHVRERSAVIGKDGKIYGSGTYDQHGSTRFGSTIIDELKKQGILPSVAIHSHGSDRIVASSISQYSRKYDENGKLLSKELLGGDIVSQYYKYLKYGIEKSLTVALDDIELFDVKGFYDSNKSVNFLDTNIQKKIADKKEEIQKEINKNFYQYFEQFVSEYGNLDGSKLKDELFKMSKTGLRSDFIEKFYAIVDPQKLLDNFFELTKNGGNSLGANLNKALVKTVKDSGVSKSSLGFSDELLNELLTKFSENLQINAKDILDNGFGISKYGYTKDNFRDLWTYNLRQITPHILEEALKGTGYKNNYQDFMKVYSKEDFIKQNPLGLSSGSLSNLFDNSAPTNFLDTLNKIVEDLKKIKEFVSSDVVSNAFNIKIDQNSLNTFITEVDRLIESIEKLPKIITDSFKSINNGNTNELLKEQGKFSQTNSNESVIEINGKSDSFKTESEVVNTVVNNEVKKLSELENKIKDVTSAVEKKTEAFKEEGRIVGTVVNGEINDLNPLKNLETSYNIFKKFYDNDDLESEAGAQAALSYYNTYKEALTSKINKKDLKPFTIGKMDELFTGNYANYKKGLEELDLSGLNSQISKYQEIIDKFNQPEVVSIISSLTEAIQKLLDAGNTSEQTTKLLTELNKAINNLGGKNSADKIAKIVTNLENFQNAVNTLNISDNEFIQSLSSILEKGEELKVLGEVLKSTKKQIDAAGNAISQKNKLNYAQDLLKNNEVAINESVNKYFSQQGKNVILQSLEATKEGFIEVTAVIEESENAYKRFVFTTTDGSDLKLKKNANATLTEVKQIKAFKEMQQIISHTQIGGLGGNNVFTPDHANWKELVVLAKSFGIELEDIRKIIRNVDKEGQESFQIFTKLSRITIGMDSDNVLFQKDEVLDFNQQIINFQNNVDTLQASLKSSFSGDDKSTQVFLNTLKDIKDTWSTIQALHGEGFGTDEELSDLLKYYNAFKTTISSISLDKISIDNKTPEFIEQFKQAENQLLSLKDVLDKVDSGTPFTDDDIAQIEKFILKMRELNTLAKDKESKLANFAGQENLLGKIEKILRKNTVMSKDLRQQFEQLSLEIKSFGDNLPADKLVEFGGRFKHLERIMEETGQTGLSFFDGIIKRAKSMSQSAISMYLSLYDIIRYIKTGVTYIRELDTALTEMRKVSDETTKSLKRFQDTSFDIAKSVGTTAKQIQESTADFMRLGNP